MIESAKVLLQKARASVEAEKFSEARRHVARVQAFHYRDAAAVTEALYLEALIDFKTGGTQAGVSALDELKALYPDSDGCRRALVECKAEATE